MQFFVGVLTLVVVFVNAEELPDKLPQTTPLATNASESHETSTSTVANSQNQREAETNSESKTDTGDKNTTAGIDAVSNVTNARNTTASLKSEKTQTVEAYNAETHPKTSMSTVTNSSADKGTGKVPVHTTAGTAGLVGAGSTEQNSSQVINDDEPGSQNNSQEGSHDNGGPSLNNTNSENANKPEEKVSTDKAIKEDSNTTKNERKSKPDNDDQLPGNTEFPKNLDPNDESKALVNVDRPLSVTIPKKTKVPIEEDKGHGQSYKDEKPDNVDQPPNDGVPENTSVSEGTEASVQENEELAESEYPSEVENAKKDDKKEKVPVYDGFGDDFLDEEEGGKGHFFAFVLTVMFLTAVIYLLYHNKRKVIAIVFPGTQRRTGTRHRGGYKANYDRLENKQGGKTYIF